MSSVECAEVECEVRPADVVGEWAFLTHPEPADEEIAARVASIKATLASAEFVRRRWLLALRRRYDAEGGQSPPGVDGAHEAPRRRQKESTGEGTAAQDAAAEAATAGGEERENYSAVAAEARAGGVGEAREAGEGEGGVNGSGRRRAGRSDAGQVAEHGAAAKNDVFFGAGAWLGGVASHEIFRRVFGYL